MLSALDVVPGQGIDFEAVGRVLLFVLAIYAAASVLLVGRRAGSSPAR